MSARAQLLFKSREPVRCGYLVFHSERLIEAGGTADLCVRPQAPFKNLLIYVPAECQNFGILGAWVGAESQFVGDKELPAAAYSAVRPPGPWPLRAPALALLEQPAARQVGALCPLSAEEWADAHRQGELCVFDAAMPGQDIRLRVRNAGSHAQPFVALLAGKSLEG